MTNFKDRIALVTGGSRGIGKAIALELAHRGATVAFNYLRSHKAACDTQAEIESLGGQCLKVKAHLGDPDKIRALFDTIKSEFGELDILVNNAASGVPRLAESLKSKHWDWIMNINARAPWLCSMEATLLMKNGGNIINITSEGSRKVLPNYFGIGASKAALEAMTRYLAVELAPKNINVNAVSGGYIDTDALRSFPNSAEMLTAGRNTLLERMMTPEDIAKVVAFLCTDDAMMIRGQVLVVDGGATL